MHLNLARGAPLFLASVTTPDEALTALAAGAALIDCKDPAHGALGALPEERVRAICAAVAGRAPVSATIGDLPNNAETMRVATEAMAAAGVDYVKIGFFGAGDARAAIAGLAKADIGAARLVAVLMADREPDFSLARDLAAAGFAAVMLDTADKSAGALAEILEPCRIGEFIAAARRHGLAAGLAGSLKLRHVAELAGLGPDILGFRGALCDGGRGGNLVAARVEAVARAMRAASETSNAA